MNRIALKIFYEGQAFHGSQIQPQARTVEGELVEILQKTGYLKSKKEASFQMASRTDAGVTAFGNVCAFTTSKKINVNQISAALPKDVTVVGSAQVSLDFNPRYANQRHYKYVACYEDHDLKAIRRAAKEMSGTHSFHNFSRTSNRNPELTIDKITVKKKNNCLVFDVYAEHFLWQQVRRMIFYLLKTGKGEKVPSLKTLFSMKTKKPVLPADSQGLVLFEVKYKKVKFSSAKEVVQKLKRRFQEKRQKRVVENTINAEF